MVDDRLHKLLLTPGAYPFPVQQVKWCETHISRLYFVDDLVLKIKKPVNFGFLDFSTQQLRRHFCREEIRLNRRFAPDTYLGTVLINDDIDRLRIVTRGKHGEWAVMMRRLPLECMLTEQIAANRSNLPADMKRLARRLASLHRHSRICRNDEGQTNLLRIRENWRENFLQTELFPETILRSDGKTQIENYVLNFLHDYAPLILDREVRGMVRDCHGDLHAEHVCLTEPIRIYDCIEFNRRFRIADTLSDIAFLIMDLQYRRRHDLAHILSDNYQEFFPLRREEVHLLSFYRIYRAYVRGKVNGLLNADEDATPDNRRCAASAARRYFNYALACLINTPQLVLTCGLMGVGKSTLAEHLAPLLNAVVLRADVIRKEIAGIAPITHHNVPFGDGLYNDDMNSLTYATLLHRALSSVLAGRSVIVDASFIRRSDREQFYAAARLNHIPISVIQISCSPETTLERLAVRQQLANDASDGRTELVQKQLDRFEFPTTTETTIIIDSQEDLDYNVQEIIIKLAARTSQT